MIEAAQPTQERSPTAPEEELLSELFLLMRNSGVFGADHPVTQESARLVQEAMRVISAPFTLEFIGAATFRNRNLIPLDLELFEQASQLAKAFANLSTHEISVDEVPSVEALLALGRALANGAIARSGELLAQRLRGMRFRDLPAAKYGEEAEQVDSQVFTAAHIALAIADAERVRATLANDSWPWVLGVAVVRRVELAIEADVIAAERAIELADGAWSPARRAVAACFHVGRVLKQLDVSRLTRRAAAHGVFAVAVAGYRERSGLPVETAARAAFAAMLAAPITAQSGVDPHRLRACTLVSRVADPSAEVPGSTTAALVKLGYELELRRCPAHVSFELTKVDLLAEIVQDMGNSLDATWVRVLVGASGCVPVGAYVLADGKLGVVMEPGPSDDPLRPKVLIGGKLVTPVQPVVLHSPIAMTPWAKQ